MRAGMKISISRGDILQCNEIEFIPVTYTDINDKRMTVTEAINYTLKQAGKKEYIEVKELNNNLYIVARSD